jgi:hypothetical protein
MSLAELFGYLAAACMLTTFAMTTMVPLRLAAIAANCLFIAYGYFGLLYPVVILHLILLPLNVTRLYQMLQLVKKVHEATRGDLSMDWLKPYMSKCCYGAGQVIFRKGDVAEQMFYTVGSGHVPCSPPARFPRSSWPWRRTGPCAGSVARSQELRLCREARRWQRVSIRSACGRSPYLDRTMCRPPVPECSRQVRWTKHLSPAARSFEHRASTAARLFASIRTRCQLVRVFSPSDVWTMTG